MNRKIIIGMGVILILFLIFFSIFSIRKNQIIDEENNTNILTPTIIVDKPTPKVTIKSLDPNVIFPTLSPKIQTEVDGIKNLRSKTPLVNSGFKVDYDYKVNKFEVIFGGGKNANKIADFKKWLISNGYGAISQQYFDYN